jgi:hypothetical protein
MSSAFVFKPCIIILTSLFFPSLNNGWFGLWCLTPRSTIFQLYGGGQFNWWRKPDYPEKTTDLSRVHLAWAGFELTTLVVIGTDSIGSYKIQLPYDHDHDGPPLKNWPEVLTIWQVVVVPMTCFYGDCNISNEI